MVAEMFHSGYFFQSLPEVTVEQPVLILSSFGAESLGRVLHLCPGGADGGLRGGTQHWESERLHTAAARV